MFSAMYKTIFYHLVFLIMASNLFRIVDSNYFGNAVSLERVRRIKRKDA